MHYFPIEIKTANIDPKIYPHEVKKVVKCLFIKAPFHQNGFSWNGLFIEYTIVSNFQNCKQNFCSTSASKLIDDLVGVTL
jgi:hypothetical protein